MTGCNADSRRRRGQRIPPRSRRRRYEKNGTYIRKCRNTLCVYVLLLAWLGHIHIAVPAWVSPSGLHWMTSSNTSRGFATMRSHIAAMTGGPTRIRHRETISSSVLRACAAAMPMMRRNPSGRSAPCSSAFEEATTGSLRLARDCLASGAKSIPLNSTDRSLAAPASAGLSRSRASGRSVSKAVSPATP